jgi:hypothetical protein
VRKNQGWAVETHIAGQLRANRRPWGKMMRHMAHGRDVLTLCISWQRNINSDAHANAVSMPCALPKVGSWGRWRTRTGK